MLLYKYRACSGEDWQSRLRDILVGEMLWCSEYAKLNDPFEGLFFHVIVHGSTTLRTALSTSVGRSVGRALGGRGGGATKKPKDLSSLGEKAATLRVLSLSSDPSSVLLWSHYADSLSGICIEIDFAGHEADVHKVDYMDNLKTLRSLEESKNAPEDLLKAKILPWEYEKEFRVIQDSNCYTATGRIRGVLLGPRISNDNEAFIRSITPENVMIRKTKVDPTRLLIST